MAESCYEQSGSAYRHYAPSTELDGTTYTFSFSANVLTVVVCDDYVDMYKDSTSLPNGCGATCRNPEEVDRNGCFSTGCCQASVNISDFYYIFLRSYDSFHRIPVEKSRRIHIRLPLVVKYKYRSLLKRDIISIWLFSEETLQN